MGGGAPGRAWWCCRGGLLGPSLSLARYHWLASQHQQATCPTCPLTRPSAHASPPRFPPRGAGALAANAMAGLSPAERAAALFDLLDTNKDGVLTKAEVVAGAPQLRMSLFEAARLFDLLDTNGDGVLQRGEFEVIVAPKIDYAREKRKKGKGPPPRTPSFTLPPQLLDFLGIAEEPAGAEEARPRVAVKRGDLVTHGDGSYTVTFRGGGKRGGMPSLGFRLVEAPRRRLAPRVDTTGYADVAATALGGEDAAQPKEVRAPRGAFFFFSTFDPCAMLP